MIVGYLKLEGEIAADTKEGTNTHQTYKEQIEVLYSELKVENSVHAHAAASHATQGNTGVQYNDIVLGLKIGPSTASLIYSCFMRKYGKATITLTRGPGPKEQFTKGNELAHVVYHLEDAVCTSCKLLSSVLGKEGLPDVMEITLACTAFQIETQDGKLNKVAKSYSFKDAKG